MECRLSCQYSLCKYLKLDINNNVYLKTNHRQFAFSVVNRSLNYAMVNI